MSNLATGIAVGIAVGNANRSAAISAERAACEVFVRGYQHDKATLEEVRQYARCAERLHPSQVDTRDFGVFVLLLVFLPMLLSAVSLLVFKRDRFDTVLEAWLLRWIAWMFGAGLFALLAWAVIAAMGGAA